MKTPLLLALLARPACGGFSNRLFEEDAEFAAALPSAERHRIALETAGEDARRARCERVWMLCLTFDVGATYNGYLRAILGTIDRVRALPPSERGEDWRSWGPYAYAADRFVTANIVREGGAFAWRIDIADRADADGIALAWGDHFEGASVRKGVGTMVLDFDALGELGWEPLRGSATMGYDFRDGRVLRLTLDEVADTSGADTEPLSATAWYRIQDGRGRFEYRAPLDVNDNGVDEELTVVARWVRGDGGRADAAVTGGDAEGWAWAVTQCWSRAGILTHEADNLGILTEVGDPRSCLFREAAEATALD